jgi:hypothetical protein
VQRNQLIILAVGLFLLLFIVLPLINRKKSSGFNQTDRGLRTLAALDNVDKGEVAWAKAHGGVFTKELADLTTSDTKLASYLATTPVTVVTLSGDAQGYVVTLASDVFQLTRVRKAGSSKAITYCIEAKSTDKVDCQPGWITNTGTVTTATTG